VDADAFFRVVETSLRALLPTVQLFRMRPANNCLLLAFGSTDDFVVAVMAATGVNIRQDVASTFDKKAGSRREIGSCFLRFDLAQNCLDVRLVYFLYEVLEMKVADGAISADACEVLKRDLAAYEDWLDRGGA